MMPGNQSPRVLGDTGANSCRAYALKDEKDLLTDIVNKAFLLSKEGFFLALEDLGGRENHASGDQIGAGRCRQG
jgi:hypothetical protein